MAKIKEFKLNVKILHIHWCIILVDIVVIRLDITLFLVQLNPILSKLGLKKARKACQFTWVLLLQQLTDMDATG